PWAFHKTMFELGLGAFTQSPRIPYQSLGSWTIVYVVLDTQACFLDLPLANTGLSLLGCLRLARAPFQSPSPFTGPQRAEAGRRFQAHSGGGLLAGAGSAPPWETPHPLFSRG